MLIILCLLIVIRNVEKQFLLCLIYGVKLNEGGVSGAMKMGWQWWLVENQLLCFFVCGSKCEKC